MMRYQLVVSGMLANPEEQAAREIRLTITNFRDVSRTLRGLFGGMTGSDFMEARADVVDREQARVPHLARDDLVARRALPAGGLDRLARLRGGDRLPRARHSGFAEVRGASGDRGTLTAA